MKGLLTGLLGGNPSGGKKERWRLRKEGEKEGRTNGRTNGRREDRMTEVCTPEDEPEGGMIPIICFAAAWPTCPSFRSRLHSPAVHVGREISSLTVMGKTSTRSRDYLFEPPLEGYTRG